MQDGCGRGCRGRTVPLARFPSVDGILARFSRSVGWAEQLVVQETRLIELAGGVVEPALSEIETRQVHVREMPRLVTRGRLRLLEPADRFLETPQPHQVGADVVVGIAECRVDLDRPMAFGDRVIESAEIAVRPPEECVPLGGRQLGDRLLVELDRAVVALGGLLDEGLLDERLRALPSVRIVHGVPAKRLGRPGSRRQPSYTTTETVDVR